MTSLPDIAIDASLPTLAVAGLLVVFGTGRMQDVVFAVAMLAGMAALEIATRYRARRAAETELPAISADA